MGTFPIPPLDVPHPFVSLINMISTSVHKTPTSYNPSMVPNLDDHLRYRDEMPLSPIKSAYQCIQSTTPATPSLGDLSPDPFRVIFCYVYGRHPLGGWTSSFHPLRGTTHHRRLPTNLDLIDHCHHFYCSRVYT
jgi:hypothetical protein